MKQHALLENEFPGRVISEKADVGWPLSSPDLTSLDFFYGVFEGKDLYQQTS